MRGEVRQLYTTLLHLLKSYDPTASTVHGVVSPAHKLALRNAFKKPLRSPTQTDIDKAGGSVTQANELVLKEALDRGQYVVKEIEVSIIITPILRCPDHSIRFRFYVVGSVLPSQVSCHEESLWNQQRFMMDNRSQYAKHRLLYLITIIRIVLSKTLSTNELILLVPCRTGATASPTSSTTTSSLTTTTSTTTTSTRAWLNQQSRSSSQTHLAHCLCWERGWRGETMQRDKVVRRLHQLYGVPSNTSLHSVVVTQECLIRTPTCIHQLSVTGHTSDDGSEFGTVCLGDGNRILLLEREIIDEFEEGSFVRCEHQKAVTDLASTPRTTQAMNVLSTVGRQSYLKNTGDIGVIHTTSRDIRGEQNTTGRLSERV